MATGSTIQYALPFPVSTDPVNVSGDIQQLAAKIDNILQETIEDTSAAMWTGGTFNNGINTPTYNDATGKMSMSLSQNIQTSASPTFAALTITGNTAINGGAITTSSTSASIFNTTATTLNVGQAATSISIGATTGTTTIRNPTIVSAASSLTIFNATSTTINFGGAATTFNIGGSTGAATMNLSSGATTNGTTKTVNVGGSGVAGSITNINLGSSVSGALGTLTVNSPTVSIPSTSISLGAIISGTWNATAIGVNRGGTGLTSFAVGDIVYASASAAFAKLGIGGNNHVLTSNGTAPVWTANTGTGNVVRAASPALSGTPTAPTAAAGTNTTQIATTAFVETALSLGAGLPSQTGNSGRFLTTNGTAASWANVPSPNNGTLTMNTSGTGISGSATFTADQSTGSTFTVTINSASAATANTLALRTSTGGLNAVSPTATGSVGLRQTYVSTSNPSGGLDGDVWLKY
jgi:hypothetical protein